MLISVTVYTFSDIFRKNTQGGGPLFSQNRSKNRPQNRQYGGFRKIFELPVQNRHSGGFRRARNCLDKIRHLNRSPVFP